MPSPNHSLSLDPPPIINQDYLTQPQAVPAGANRRCEMTQLSLQADYRLAKQKEQAYYPQLAQLLCPNKLQVENQLSCLTGHTQSANLPNPCLL